MRKRRKLTVKNPPFKPVFESLLKFVRFLHANKFYHKKRGFRLDKSTPLSCLTHLMEEVVELQAEACLAEDYELSLEEATDVLAVYCHIIVVMKFPPEELITKCWQKVAQNFTPYASEVMTKTPGFTRQNRKKRK